MNRKKVIIICLFATIFILSSRKIMDFDIWWHLKTGEYIWENKKIPHKDLFSYTAENQEWTTHEWLSEVVFYLFYKYFGLISLIFLKGFIISITFYFIFVIAMKKAENINKAVFVVMLSMLTSAGSFLERPQIFSYLFFSILLYFLFLYKNGENYLFLIPTLALLWTNSHSSFPLLFLIFSVFLLNEIIKKNKIKNLIFIMLFSLIFSFFNPNSYKIFLYPFYTIFNPAHLENILEWHSPNFHLLQNLFFEFTLLFSFYCFIKTKKINFEELILFLIFTHLSLYAVRNLPYFGLFSGAILGKYIKDLSLDISFLKKYDERATKEIPLLNYGFLIFIIIFLIYKVPHSNKLSKCVEVNDFPIKAVDFIKKEKLSGNIFNDYDWGGYFIFNLYPEHKVFIDGRMDVYANKVLDDYLKLARVRDGWEEIINKYQLKYFLVKKNSLLHSVLKESDGFKIKYKDEISVIFEKK